MRVCGVCHAVKLTLEFFVATALWAVNESIEMPFFRGLDEHFFALQTIFGVLHVRCDNVCLKTRFIPPFHVQQKKRWIIRALGPVVNLASFFIETRRCDLCDDLFHRSDCVSASVEARGDNVRMESHSSTDTHRLNADSVPLKSGEIHRAINGHISPNLIDTVLTPSM